LLRGFYRFRSAGVHSIHTAPDLRRRVFRQQTFAVEPWAEREPPAAGHPTDLMLLIGLASAVLCV